MTKKKAVNLLWDSSICDTGMFLALVGMLCLVLVSIGGSDEARHDGVVWFSLILGFGVGMLLIRMNWVEAWTGPGWVGSEIFCVASCGVGLAALTYWCGMRQFGGADPSVIIDSGWRLYCGQKPYVDFPCTVPVESYMGAELAFRLFGVFWSSLIKLTVGYFLLTYFWMYVLLRYVFQNRLLAFLVVITCESMSLILVSYWWYNPVTSLTVVLYTASVAAVLIRPRNRWLWVSLCMSLVLTALMKPNVAGIAIIGGTCSLLFSPSTRWRTCAVSAAAFVLWLGILATHGLTMTQVLGSYFSVASRAISSEGFLAHPSPTDWYLAWLGLFAVLPGWVRAAWFKAPLHQRTDLLILAGFGLLASLDGFYSNSELKIVDMPLAVLSAAILLACIPSEGPALRVSSVWLAYLILMCSTFTVLSLGEAITRHRILAIWNGLFFEYQMEETPLKTRFFSGLRAGHNLHVTESAIADLCASRNVDHAYFGPRLEWAYAAFHIPSPKGLPIFWDKGVGYPLKDEGLETNRWINDQFNPIVIQNSGDLVSTAPGMLKSIINSYVLEGAYPLDPPVGPVLILSRRKVVQ